VRSSVALRAALACAMSCLFPLLACGRCPNGASSEWPGWFWGRVLLSLSPVSHPGSPSGGRAFSSPPGLADRINPRAARIRTDQAGRRRAQRLGRRHDGQLRGWARMRLAGAGQLGYRCQDPSTFVLGASSTFATPRERARTVWRPPRCILLISSTAPDMPRARLGSRALAFVRSGQRRLSEGAAGGAGSPVPEGPPGGTGTGCRSPWVRGAARHSDRDRSLPR